MEASLASRYVDLAEHKVGYSGSVLSIERLGTSDSLATPPEHKRLDRLDPAVSC